MIKRIIPFLLSFSLILAFVPVSASASESDSNDLKCIDVLAYDYPDNGSSVRGIMSSSTPYNKFELPFSYALVFFDVIFETPQNVLSAGMRSVTSGNVLPLTLVSLGSNKYRAYGQSSTPFNSSSFAFQVDCPSAVGTYYVNYYKFNVYTVVDVGTGDLGEMNITPNSDTSVSPNTWYRQSSPGSRIYQQFYYFSQSENFLEFTSLFSSVNWRKYDYLDFSLEFDVANITSISAYILLSDGTRRYLSFDISYLESGVIDKNEFIDSGGAYSVPSYSFYDILMRLYIPASYRVSGSLYIEVNGKYHAATSSACINSVVGYYYTTVPSPDLTKLDQIKNAIVESLSSTSEEDAAAEDFSQNMTSQKEQMSANQAEIDSVNKPSAGDLGMIASSNAVLDSSGMSALTTIITPVTSNRMVLSILTISATLALVSYVFFGKKR